MDFNIQLTDRGRRRFLRAIRNSSLERLRNMNDPNAQAQLQFPPVPAQIQVQVPAVPTVFISNPYKGDINPGVSADRKLYLDATKERDEDKMILVTQSKTRGFLDIVTYDSTRFAWGSLIHRVRTT